MALAALAAFEDRARVLGGHVVERRVRQSEAVTGLRRRSPAGPRGRAGADPVRGRPKGSAHHIAQVSVTVHTKKR